MPSSCPNACAAVAIASAEWVLSAADLSKPNNAPVFTPDCATQAECSRNARRKRFRFEDLRRYLGYCSIIAVKLYGLVSLVIILIHKVKIELKW
jgi:hypothetical protein